MRKQKVITVVLASGMLIACFSGLSLIHICEELNALMHNITENCSIMTTEAESMVADLSKFKLEKETKTE